MDVQSKTTTTNDRSDRGKRRRYGSSLGKSDESDDEATHAPSLVTFDRFFVIEALEGGSLGKFSPFAVQKFLQCRVGNVKSARKLQSGALLVEVSTSVQAASLSLVNTFVDVPVKVTAHRTLNSCRGIIRCRDLRDCGDDEVLGELQSQGVSAVKHILVTRNDHKEPTNTFILTFNAPILPPHIKVGFLRVPVEMYIPNPLRCFGCQRYGHGKSTCKRAVVCARCGQEGHDDKSCSSPHHCANCSGDHPAYSRDCPKWRFQVEVTKVKFEKSVSFREAEKLVQQRSSITSSPAAGRSFADVGAPAARPARLGDLREAQCQTDLTWPINSPLPLVVDHVTVEKSTFVASASQTDDVLLATTTSTVRQSTPAAAAGAGSKLPSSTGVKPTPLLSPCLVQQAAQGALAEQGQADECPRTEPCVRVPVKQQGLLTDLRHSSRWTWQCLMILTPHIQNNGYSNTMEL
jgi:hypothetical protein